MLKKEYTLKEILDSTMKVKNGVVKKRIIFDKSFLGGVGSKWLIFGLIMLPFIIYIAVFNSASFKYLGIAQAIILYIILLVVAMQVVIGISYFNNKSVVKLITPSWQRYFPDIDIKMILSSGVTPYMDFKKHYAKALKDEMKEEKLLERLKEAFKQMKEENNDLIEAMNRSKKI